MGMGQGMRHMTTAAAVVPLIITGAGTTGAALACLCAHGGLPVVKLFYNRRPLTKAVRNLGLNLLDLSPGLQRFLLRRATGLHAFPLDREWAWARECGT